MQNKVLSMKEAISSYVKDGMVIYAAGFTHLMPFAATHEIIRQGRRDLTLCRLTPDVLYEQMVVAGCAKKVVYSFSGNPGLGPLRLLRKYMETHEVEIEEYCHFGMTARIYAGAINVPFMMLRSYEGGDLPNFNPNIKKITCPYTNEELFTVPALKPDVGIIHAHRADIEGNTQIWGILGVQKEVAFASKKLIVVVEEIVESNVIRSDPNRTIIPGFVVDAIVVEPWGAHPSYVQGYYDRDNPFFIEWEQISANEDGVKNYLNEWVFGVKDRQEYISKISPEKLTKLRGQNNFSLPVDYGLYP